MGLISYNVCAISEPICALLLNMTTNHVTYFHFRVLDSLQVLLDPVLFTISEFDATTLHAPSLLVILILWNMVLLDGSIFC